ncbi:MAG: Gfo/Idh/MocA family oxidoreductase [Sedimentisphaerales bacterium]|nr:Gfo/Idh/MocA family oxidoreductase [Sedimentisphaerales bacterium]
MLKIGIIGLSEGNGHPYSWSAIINGDYDTKLMEDCGYPVIPAYLGANRDTLGVDCAQVTHIWTQDAQLSAKVAKASLIDNVCDNMEDMIGQVDAVLLARDDPENHVAMAKPFLDANVPLFIDKPLAFSWEDLEYFTKQVAAGKFVMSSSALRYSAGVQSMRDQVAGLGKIELAVAVGKKDLRKYAIHYLEGMFALLGDPKPKTVRHMGPSGKNTIYIEFENGMLAMVHVFMDIAPGGELNIYGQNGVLQVNHGGAYPMFRSHLVETVRSFTAGKPRLDFAITRNVIAALIAARESFENDGRIVDMTKVLS